MQTRHDIEFVRSGDVLLHVRRFGHPGDLPVMIMHGANYFDSSDWIEVAEMLAVDREVVAFDARGFGGSGWSESKLYSHGELLADMSAVMNHVSWPKCALVGHSRGGAYSMLFASRFPEKTALLALVDYNPELGFGPPGSATQAPAAVAKVFSTLEEAVANTSRHRLIPEGSAARQRAKEIFEPVEGGYALARRDPHFANSTTNNRNGRPEVIPGTGWDELSAVKCPVLVVRASKSPVFSAEHIARMQAKHPSATIVNVESSHDIAGESPRELTAILREWLKSPDQLPQREPSTV